MSISERIFMIDGSVLPGWVRYVVTRVNRNEVSDGTAKDALSRGDASILVRSVSILEN